MTLDILDARGSVVRSLSSADPVLVPDPALDPAGYDRICRESIDAQVCHVWDVKDGKVTRFQQYVDTAKIPDAMGVR